MTPSNPKNLKKASNHKMSENRPSPNMSTDSKTTFEIFKLKNQTKKLPLKIQTPKISLKSQNVRKPTPPNMPILIPKQLSKSKVTQIKSDPKSNNLTVRAQRNVFCNENGHIWEG